MSEKHLFTATSEYGWKTVISITNSDKIEMNEGSGHIVTLSIKDIKKIVKEYNKAMKEGKSLLKL